MFVVACWMFSFFLFQLLHARSFSWGTWDPFPQPEIEPGPPALRSWSLSHRSTREVQILPFLKLLPHDGSMAPGKPTSPAPSSSSPASPVWKKTPPRDKGASKCGCHVSNPFSGNRLAVLFAFGFHLKDFHGGSDSKASTYNAGGPGSIPGSERSGERNGNPLQYFCLEKSHEWRTLVGYSPSGCKE